MKITRLALWLAAFGSAILSGCQHTERNHPSIHKIAATDPAISVMGRTQAHAGEQIFGFPGVSFFVEVIGSELTATLSSSSGNSWIDVIVDEEPARVIAVPSVPTEITLFKNASSQQHRVRITHRTENWQGQVTLHNLQLTGSQFLPAPPLPTRKLLVLGDSVTCGEGVDRDEQQTKTSRWWNARESFGALTGEALNMQYQLVCWGGRGLVRSWDGKTDDGNLADYYQVARGNPSEIILWEHNQFSADIIVSAIGTNDFSEGIPDRNHYLATYTALIQQLLRDHPKAIIILTEGSILHSEKKAALTDYLTTLVRTIHSDRLFYAASDHHPGSPVDAHPTREQHQQMAKQLTQQIRNLTAIHQ